MSCRGGRSADWLLRSRTTGEITVGQRPNASALLAAASIVAEQFAAPGTDASRCLRFTTLTLASVWCAGEIVRGVNPFRRVLGVTALVGTGLYSRTRC